MEDELAILFKSKQISNVEMVFLRSKIVDFDHDFRGKNL